MTQVFSNISSSLNYRGSHQKLISKVRLGLETATAHHGKGVLRLHHIPRTKRHSLGTQRLFSWICNMFQCLNLNILVSVTAFAWGSRGRGLPTHPSRRCLESLVRMSGSQGHGLESPWSRDKASLLGWALAWAAAQAWGVGDWMGGFLGSQRRKI